MCFTVEKTLEGDQGMAIDINQVSYNMREGSKVLIGGVLFLSNGFAHVTCL